MIVRHICCVGTPWVSTLCVGGSVVNKILGRSGEQVICHSLSRPRCVSTLPLVGDKGLSHGLSGDPVLGEQWHSAEGLFGISVDDPVYAAGFSALKIMTHIIRADLWAPPVMESITGALWHTATNGTISETVASPNELTPEHFIQLLWGLKKCRDLDELGKGTTANFCGRFSQHLMALKKSGGNMSVDRVVSLLKNLGGLGIRNEMLAKHALMHVCPPQLNGDAPRLLEVIADHRLRLPPLADDMAKLCIADLKGAQGENNLTRRNAASSLMWNCARLDLPPRLYLEECESVLFPRNSSAGIVSELSLSDLSKVGLAYFMAEVEQEKSKQIAKVLNDAAPLLASYGLDELRDAEVGPEVDSTGGTAIARLRVVYNAAKHLSPLILESLDENHVAAFNRLQNIHPAVRKDSLWGRDLDLIAGVKSGLQRLRISVDKDAFSNPYVIPILERDVPMIWDCALVKDMFPNSNAMLPEGRLKDRILRARGFSIASVSTWHWGHLTSWTAKMEYVRMARYYALRDRRVFDPDFEGWTLSNVQWKANKSATSIHIKGYYPHAYKPLSHVDY